MKRRPVNWVQIRENVIKPEREYEIKQKGEKERMDERVNKRI